MEQNVSTEKKSSEVIVVTSGKGGVGKTTTSANVGTGPVSYTHLTLPTT